VEQTPPVLGHFSSARKSNMEVTGNNKRERDEEGGEVEEPPRKKLDNKEPSLANNESSLTNNEPSLANNAPSLANNEPSLAEPAKVEDATAAPPTSQDLIAEEKDIPQDDQETTFQRKDLEEAQVDGKEEEENQPASTPTEPMSTPPMTQVVEDSPPPSSQETLTQPIDENAEDHGQPASEPSESTQSEEAQHP